MFRIILSVAIIFGVLGPGPAAGQPAVSPEPVVEMPGQTIAPGPGSLVLKIVLPPGYKFTPEAPCVVKLASTQPKVVALPPETTAPASQNPFPLELALTAQPGKADVHADLQLFFCKTEGSGLCLIKTLRLRLPVQVTSAASSHRLEVAYQLPAP